MSDEIIKELWQIKDNIAREHGYDLEALVAHLQTKKRPEGQCVVDLRAIREAAEQGAAGDALTFGPSSKPGKQGHQPEKESTYGRNDDR